MESIQARGIEIADATLAHRPEAAERRADAARDVRSLS